MNITFDGKVAIVTGAASGIGLACAELLATSGARVALVDFLKPLYTEHLTEVTESVQKKGFAKGYPLDVTDIPAINPTITSIRQEMGEVDILICSAGINRPSTSEDITEADWDAILSTNIKGLFFCNQAVAIQSMIPRKIGAIVNVASTAGLAGMEMSVCPAHYSASKGAVVQLTRKEAVEWAPYNIRVNAVAPTFTLTAPVARDLKKHPEIEAAVLDSTPLHCMATVDDIAAAICFLASDAAKMITGVTLPVDGGWTAQ